MAFMSRENKISGVEFGLRNGIGRGAGGWMPLEGAREKDGGAGSQSGTATVSPSTSTSRLPSQLYPETITSTSLQPSQARKDTGPLDTFPVDAFKNDAELSNSDANASIIPIFDAKTSTTSRVISRGRSKKPISARTSRSTVMPWVHASPPDLWQIVQPSASSSSTYPSKHNHLKTQPSYPHPQHTSGSARRGGGSEDPLLRGISQPITRPVPKAIGSERRQRLQLQQEQPTYKAPPPADLNWTPPSPNSWTTSVMPLSTSLDPTSKTALGPSKRYAPQITITIPEKSKNLRVAPLPLPTPPSTPPLQLTVVELTPAPEYQRQLKLQTDAAAAFKHKHELVTRFNDQRSRRVGGKNVSRFSSPLNPAMETMGVTFQDCVDVEKKEREKLGLAGVRGREKTWNYFRKPQVVGTRSRVVCERWNGGGSGSINSYLRGSEQKHCLGCRREGLRVRLMVVGVWRWGVLFGEPGDSQFEDDDDDDIFGTGEKGRFVMDYWDDDEECGSGRGMLLKKEKDSGGDVPMDVDHDTDSVLDIAGPDNLEAELARASDFRMEVDSDSHSKAPETEWIGGVPDSPRLKDLDDFDEV
ncbi:hypothetical protein V5O48_004008 [Marasmius crinis-equi]|uniref:Uncharacterized protein n=1 Tax=Marasmius crinis-equi TaxID=585013 RepID=A0ABR3FRC4_9AGAR